MPQALMQLWTNGKSNFKKSYHWSRDDVQAFAHAEYRNGSALSNQWVQTGAPAPVQVTAATLKAIQKAMDEGKYGIWM